jgi:uncharacterized protein YdbL (DUF1318 family)
MNYSNNKLINSYHQRYTMRSRFNALPILVVIFSLLLAGNTLYAASIKDQMAARIPTINNLKDSGLIGENNTGYLEYRSGQQPEQEVVNGENSDRQKVYGAIAKKEGVSPVLVGQRRAQMIAEKGKPGHWYQAENGKWYQK